MPLQQKAVRAFLSQSTSIFVVFTHHFPPEYPLISYVNTREMENYILKEDISVICITATSFPDGVMAAHEKLHALFPFSTERKYYGLSRPDEQHVIIYKAAVEELTPGEAEKLNLEKFILKKGEYISIDIINFMNDIPAIGKAFQELLADPRLDPNGICVEWYYNETDVKCMIRILSNQI
jgi:hypothetical protein